MELNKTLLGPERKNIRDCAYGLLLVKAFSIEKQTVMNNVVVSQS